MEKILVSVIVPVYNAERYVGQCIDSILNQSYRNIEVILINDGSSDDSLTILKKYKNQDKRIKLIDRENKGSIYSRLEGFHKALGNYIMFIDSDDWIDPDTIMDSLKTILKYNADILRFNMVKEFINEKRTRKIEGISKTEVCFTKCELNSRLFPYLLNSYKLNSMCAQFIRKESIKLKFNIDDYNIKMGDDLLCNIQILNQINSFVSYPKYFYHYRTTENSITTTITYNKIKSNIDDVIKVYSTFGNYMNMWDDNAEISKNIIAKKVLTEVISSLRPIFINKFKHEEKKNLVDYAREQLNKKYVFCGQKLSFKEFLFANGKNNLFLLYEIFSEGITYTIKLLLKKVLFLIKEKVIFK